MVTVFEWRKVARSVAGGVVLSGGSPPVLVGSGSPPTGAEASPDRKSTRLNSSHSQTSYAVCCLKKKISSGENDAGHQRVRASRCSQWGGHRFLLSSMGWPGPPWFSWVCSLGKNTRRRWMGG